MGAGALETKKAPAPLVDACASRIGDPLLRLRFLRRLAPPPPSPKKKRGIPRWVIGLLLALTCLIGPIVVSSPAPSPRRPVQRSAALLRSRTPRISPDAPVPRVWLAERTAQSELYSNGLRIENDFLTLGKPRLYKAFARSGGGWRWGAEPVGIVFHSSESDTAEFEPEQNHLLHRQGRNLLAYAREHQCYNFVIDRFGRVHRIIDENSKADHAGHSVWADADWIYLNLNNSFIGVCLEAQPGAGGVSAAQVHSAKILVEALRFRYRIPAGNCITHAQVSVNPRNYLVGYHTDWAQGFPFAEVGLPDNYALPLPSLLLFGFAADSFFVDRAGASLRQALSDAEEQVRQAAAARQISQERYISGLKKNYAATIAAAGGSAVM